MRINQHFYFSEDGKKFNNDCGYGCCCHCKYFLSGKEGNHSWLACNQSCLESKEMIGKSCSDCKHSSYGKKID